jgi:hypothetical protein
MDDKLESLEEERKNTLEKLKKINEDKKTRREQLAKEKHSERKTNGDGNHANKLIRVSNEFDDELESIQEDRVNNGRDTSKTSKPKLTGLIVKHNFWSKIKDDLVLFNFSKKNKKGQVTILVSILIIFLLFALIILFIGGVFVVRMNDALSQDVQIGQVNLANTTAATFGKFATAYLNSADWWGVAIIFGTVLGLFASSFFLRGTSPKWVLILDIFIILAMWLVSLYVASSYNIMVNALSAAGETFLEVYTPKTSAFMLNLPIFIVIIAVISMVLFHSSIPRRREEAATTGAGLLAGA